MRRKTVGPSPDLLAILLAITVFALDAARLRFGVDFTDESFYAAVPHRFALGLQPFRDERAFQQLSFLLSYPLVKVWLAVVGSSNGLILMLRAAYLTLTTLAAAAAYVALRRRPLDGTALVAATFPLAFIPYQIPALSYNTLGIALLTLTAYLQFFWWRTGNHAAWRRSIPALLVLTTLSYVSQAATAYVLLLAYTIVRTKSSRACLRASLFYGLAVLVGVGVLGAAFGPENLRLSFDYTMLTGAKGGGIAKLLQAYDQLRGSFDALGGYVVCLTAGALVRWRGGRAARFSGALSVLAFALLAADARHIKPNLLVAHVALAAPFLLVGRERRAERWAFGLLVVAPALFGGLVASWTSAESVRNLIVGGVAASVATLFLLMEDLQTSLGARRGLRGLALLPGSALIAYFVLLSWENVYRDHPVRDLTASIPSGPFAGMRTTPARARFEAQFAADLQELSSGARSAGFYYHFPAGYLYTSLRPALCEAWVVDYAADDALVFQPQIRDCLHRMAQGPTIFFRMKVRFEDEPEVLRLPKGDPVTPMIEACPARILRERAEYVVYFLDRGCTGGAG